MSALEALNRYRQRAGRVRLAEDAALVALAGQRAGEIARHYAHWDAAPASEVLTVGRLDAEGAVWEWLSWAPHRAILMNPQAGRAGFGSYEQNGQTYWVGLIGG